MTSLLRILRTSRASTLPRPSTLTHPSHLSSRANPPSGFNFSASAFRKEFSKDVKSAKSIQDQTQRQWFKGTRYLMIGALGGLIGGLLPLGGVYALYQWEIAPLVAKYGDKWDNVKSGVAIGKKVTGWLGKKKGDKEETEVKETLRVGHEAMNGKDLETEHDQGHVEKGMDEGEDSVLWTTRKAKEGKEGKAFRTQWDG